MEAALRLPAAEVEEDTAAAAPEAGLDRDGRRCSRGPGGMALDVLDRCDEGDRGVGRDGCRGGDEMPPAVTSAVEPLDGVEGRASRAETPSGDAQSPGPGAAQGLHDHGAALGGASGSIAKAICVMFACERRSMMWTTRR